MSDFLARARVVLGAAVTYLIAAGVGLSAASAEIAEVAPPGWETATAWLVRGVAWLGAAVVVVRRVKEVIGPERGLLPSPPMGVTIHVTGAVDAETVAAALRELSPPGR
jgi:hypothetical protein